MSSCKLKEMFDLRKSFIKRMQKERPGSYPIPVPLTCLSDKKSQQVCRDLALRGVEEMFEASKTILLGCLVYCAQGESC